MHEVTMLDCKEIHRAAIAPQSRLSTLLRGLLQVLSIHILRDEAQGAPQTLTRNVKTSWLLYPGAEAMARSMHAKRN